MKYVEIENGVVVSGPWVLDHLPDISAVNRIAVDVTNITPEPKEYWAYSNDVFVEGFPPETMELERVPWVMPVEQLRLERNDLLEKTDYRDLPSYPGSDQEAWREYRQELRDLPASYTPDEIPTFPTPPNN